MNLPAISYYCALERYGALERYYGARALKDMARSLERSIAVSMQIDISYVPTFNNFNIIIHHSHSTPTMASAQTTMPPRSPSFDDLPRHIATLFILPYVNSSDWLSFRVSSRRCYETVHGSSAAEDVTQFVCPTCRIRGASTTPTATTRCNNAATNTFIRESSSGDNVLSENLWKLALVRDFMFEDGDDHDDVLLMHKSLHSPVEPVSDAFVSTQNMFTASNLFVSWMHWRKLYLRLNPPG